MDTDVSHEVERRLTALEEKVGIGTEEEPPEGETKPVDPDEELDLPQEVDAEEEAD